MAGSDFGGTFPSATTREYIRKYGYTMKGGWGMSLQFHLNKY